MTTTKQQQQQQQKAIEHHQNTTTVATLTTTAVVGELEGQHTEVDWSGTAPTSCSGSSSCWWQADASNTTSTRVADMFPSLSVFRHHQTTLQGATGAPDDTERLIDEANDKSIL